MACRTFRHFGKLSGTNQPQVTKKFTWQIFVHERMTRRMGAAIAIDRAKAEQIIHDIFQGIAVKTAIQMRKADPRDFFTTVWNCEELSIRYTQAQQAKAEIYVEEIMEIADGYDDPQKARNRIEARKWYASKMQPHKYSDRIDINVTQKLDLSSALAEARRRIEPKEIQLIESADQTSEISNMLDTSGLQVSDDDDNE